MNAGAVALADIDVGSGRHHANPYPTYAWLREHAPVATGRMSTFGRVWLVSRYEDVLNGLRHPALSSDLTKRRGVVSHVQTRWLPGIVTTLQQSMVTTDDPDHRRLRELVHVAFTPRVVEGMKQRIEEISTGLLDRMASKRHVDLIADFALPLPLEVISKMIGVPQEERLRFHRWSAGFLEIASKANPLAMIMHLPNGIRLMRLFDRLIEERKRAPSDDLISGLVQAEASGDRLSKQEVLSMIFLLLLAGHETTVNLVASGVLALLEHPDQLERLRAQPDLIGTAVEEMLRYCNPVEHGNVRIALEDIEIAGQRIPKQSIVVLLLASANRDESMFDRPECFDVARDPNRHLAFGFGIHYCLGAPLSRLEAQIAVRQLVSRFPRMRLAIDPSQLRWRSAVAIRGLEHLPLDL
jgi:cytochrome P450 PksS